MAYQFLLKTGYEAIWFVFPPLAHHGKLEKVYCDFTTMMPDLLFHDSLRMLDEEVFESQKDAPKHDLKSKPLKILEVTSGVCRIRGFEEHA